MKGGRIIFVFFFFGPTRQTESNFNLISTIKITARAHSLKGQGRAKSQKSVSVPSSLPPDNVCVNSVARGWVKRNWDEANT